MATSSVRKIVAANVATHGDAMSTAAERADVRYSRVMNSVSRRRIIVALTGATGAVYGVRVLAELRRMGGIETHVVISKAGLLSAAAELDLTRRELEGLADVAHSERDVGASIASGSFRTDGMIVAPCSMRTLAAIATGVTDNLVSRAADVVLKERRRLVLLARETPLTLVHLRNMATVTEMGGIVFPPVPAFYAKLDSLDAMIDQTVGRVLDLFDLDSPLVRRWSGVREPLDE
jgi:polyprenyl P-hydroxybenzoate/phenylacrylic acid decarboxylase-like protein